MEHYRISSESSVYYVTYSITDWLPVFVSGPAFRVIIDSLKFCHGQKHLRINAYVIMPTHFHAIVFDADYDSERLNRTLTDFRKFTGRQLADYCDHSMPACFGDAIKKGAIGDRERRLWQPSRHPVALVNEKFWEVKLNYLHENPMRKGLVSRPEHWRYSSAQNYLAGERGIGELPIDWLRW